MNLASALRVLATPVTNARQDDILDGIQSHADPTRSNATRQHHNVIGVATIISPAHSTEWCIGNESKKKTMKTMSELLHDIIQDTISLAHTELIQTEQKFPAIGADQSH